MYKMCIIYIQIYPSEFGKERLQMEQSQGPLELLVSLPEDPEKDSEEEKYDSDCYSINSHQLSK